MEEDNVFDLTLLYVEDEPDTREQLAEFLRRRVRQLLVAANGHEGIELYQRHRPELVVTDIRMPLVDGLSMAREIKDLDRWARIVVTTAHSDTGYLLEAIEADIDGYVLKPVDTRRLLAVLAKQADIVALRKAELRHQHEREELVAELRAALAKVKVLSGFLPICSSCKKIRDDQGYWRQIEAYIRDHSEAEFTHSLCPECIRRLYPDLPLAPNGG